MKRSAIVAVLVLLVAGAAVVGAYTLHAPDMAKQIVAACANSGGDHSTCYETEVPALYPKYSVPQIFDIVREIRSLDPSYQFCHVLGHKIGERVVAEDPDKWVDAIPLNPTDGLCSNGFIHGVIGGRFRAEVLDDATLQKFLPDFKIACEAHNGWQPTELDRAMCYHAMGHLFDYITNADIPHALTLCRSVAPTDLQRVCIEGVFMQIYQPLEPDDFALIAQMKVKPTAQTVRSYCALYRNDPVAEGSCLEESWPFFRDQVMTGKGIAQFCTGQPNATEEQFCYQSSFALAGRRSLGNHQQMLSICADTASKWQPMCYENGAQTILEEERTNYQEGIDFCNASPADQVPGCLTYLAHVSSFLFGTNTSEQRAFCSRLPQEYQSLCMRR